MLGSHPYFLIKRNKCSKELVSHLLKIKHFNSDVEVKTNLTLTLHFTSHCTKITTFYRTSFPQLSPKFTSSFFVTHHHDHLHQTSLHYTSFFTILLTITPHQKLFLWPPHVPSPQASSHHVSLPHLVPFIRDNNSLYVHSSIFHNGNPEIY